eukprot:Gb_03385 [translate_table: standard]
MLQSPLGHHFVHFPFSRDYFCNKMQLHLTSPVGCAVLQVYARQCLHYHGFAKPECNTLWHLQACAVVHFHSNLQWQSTYEHHEAADKQTADNNKGHSTA